MIGSILPVLIGTVFGGLITIWGWYANYYFSRRKETEVREQEMRIRFLQQQIEELYAPLWALIEQSEIIYGIACKKLPVRENGRMDRDKFTAKDNEIYVFFNENYFLPINLQIADLIRKKIHLLYNGILPESFDDFIHHQIMGESLYRLWKTKNIDSSNVRSKGYPVTFNEDVKSTLNQLRQEYLKETTMIRQSVRKRKQS